MRKRQGIAEQLSPAICVATVLTSFGPYMTAYYFPITILVFILFIAFFEIRNYLWKRYFAPSKKKLIVVRERNNNFKTKSYRPRRRLTIIKKDSLHKFGNHLSKRKFQSMRIVRPQNETEWNKK